MLLGDRDAMVISIGRCMVNDPEAVINAVNLTKYYGPRRAIEDVTFSVSKGRSSGFWGRMGPARQRPSARC